MMGSWEGIDEAVAVAAAGSFARAASALGVSTSHVSRAVARLEAMVQTPLFHRTTRKVALTDDGRVLIEQLRRVVQERDEALAAIATGGEPQGEIRLTCSTALGERFVAPIMRQLALEYPRLTVALELTNRVVDLIGEGFDLAIRTGQLADSRLIGTRIASRSLYACAAPSYLASRPAPVEIGDLAQHDCLGGTAATWHFAVGDQEVNYRVRGRWRCNSGAAIVDAAIAGMGVCQLPGFYVLAAIQAGQLVPVLEAFRPGDEPIWAVYPQQRHLLPKVRVVVDRLRRDLQDRLNATGAPAP